MIIDATYTTVLDDWIHCVSACRIDMSTLRVVSVEIAANADNPEVDRADACTDIFVTLPDATELREEDGLIDGHYD